MEFHERTKHDKNAIYRLQISALVPEISKFEKCVKYENETTHTQPNFILNQIENRAISVNCNTDY